MQQKHTHSRRGSAGLEEHHVHRNNVPLGHCTGLHKIKLRRPKPANTLHALKQILHSAIIVKLRPVPRCPDRPNHQPPRAPLPVENPVVTVGRRQALIENHPNVHLLEGLGCGERPGSVAAAYLLVGDEGEVDGAGRDKARVFEAADGFQVLEADGLHVLGAAGEDAAGGVGGGGEGGVGPLVGLGGDDVGVGVEEDGGEGGVAARPLEEEEGLGVGGGEVECAGGEGEGVGDGEEEVGGEGVGWVGVGGVDSKVLLESGDGIGVGVGVGGGGSGEEEEEEIDEDEGGG